MLLFSLHAPVVKWISQRSSKPLFWVRILAGAQKRVFKGYFWTKGNYLNSKGLLHNQIDNLWINVWNMGIRDSFLRQVN